MLVAAAIALLVGLLLSRRQKPPQIAADSTTQIAALRAAAEASASEPERDEDGSAAEAAADAADAAARTQALSVRAETRRSLREVAFGRPIPLKAAETSAADPICAQVAAALGNIVDKPNYAPRRPMQLPKLMHAINDETASRGALAQIIAGDPALAGNLLRLANSPFYRHSPDPIESLDRAVAMLGIEGLRSMIAAALLQPVFRISGGSFARFGEVTWEHSLYAAGAAEGYANLVESADPFAAQLLSLIVGLATIVVFSVAQDAFLGRQRAPDAAIIAALIDAHGGCTGYTLAVGHRPLDRSSAAIFGKQ